MGLSIVVFEFSEVTLDPRLLISNFRPIVLHLAAGGWLLFSVGLIDKHVLSA